MPTTRSYHDACGIARALDAVGERWALLVVRELLFGPARFSDLRRALPHASSNLVADRVRELTARGILERHTLPAPAGSRVYGLTDRGRALEPIVVALGAWGVSEPFPDEPLSLSPTSVLLYLRTAARPDPDRVPVTCEVQLDDRVWAVGADGDGVHIGPVGTAPAEAVIRTDPWTLNGILADPATLDAAVERADLEIRGDGAAARRLLGLVAGTP